jgi:hypothetical protein
VKRKRRGECMRAKLQEIKEELRPRMHQPKTAQGKRLGTQSVAALASAAQSENRAPGNG